VEETLEQELLEIKVIAGDRSIVCESQCSDEAAQSCQVLFDQTLLLVLLRLVRDLVELYLVDQHAALEDLDSLRDRALHRVWDTELANQVCVDVQLLLELHRDTLSQDVVDEPLKVDLAWHDDKLQVFKFCLEVCLARVVANEFDGLLSILSR
jgi:hypothetical protein